MDENLVDRGKLIPGWHDYVRFQADRIEASFGENVVEGKIRAGYFEGAAEIIRQVTQREVGTREESWIVVSRVLQSKHVTREQLEGLWCKAQGDHDELIHILQTLSSLGELEEEPKTEMTLEV